MKYVLGPLAVLACACAKPDERARPSPDDGQPSALGLRGKSAPKDDAKRTTSDVLTDVVEVVSVIPAAVCALDKHGRVFCWGEWTRESQQHEIFTRPQRVIDLPPVRQLAPFDHNLAVTTDGRVFEWRLDPERPILRAKETKWTVPDGVRLRPDARSKEYVLKAVAEEAKDPDLLGIVDPTSPRNPDPVWCSVERSGRVECAELWDARHETGSTTLQLPAGVKSLGGSGIDGGVVAVLTDMRTVTWGPDGGVRVRESPRVVQASREGGLTCGVDEQHVVHCWSDFTEDGRVDGTAHRVPTAGPATRVVVQSPGAYAIQTNGTVKCWGLNSLGECGVGDRRDVVEDPTFVLGPGPERQGT